MVFIFLYTQKFLQKKCVQNWSHTRRTFKMLWCKLNSSKYCGTVQIWKNGEPLKNWHIYERCRHSFAKKWISPSLFSIQLARIKLWNCCLLVCLFACLFIYLFWVGYKSNQQNENQTNSGREKNEMVIIWQMFITVCMRLSWNVTFFIPAWAMSEHFNLPVIVYTRSISRFFAVGISLNKILKMKPRWTNKCHTYLAILLYYITPLIVGIYPKNETHTHNHPKFFFLEFRCGQCIHLI